VNPAGQPEDGERVPVLFRRERERDFGRRLKKGDGASDEDRTAPIDRLKET
jgi:hypothetical protein